MIKSYHDYKYYREADRIALNVNRNGPAIIGDEIWKFEILLRKREYFKNCKTNILLLPYKYFITYLFHNMSLKLGFEIPLNVFGPGLAIAHRGTIIINTNAIIGRNCPIASSSV